MDILRMSSDILHPLGINWKFTYQYRVKKLTYQDR